MLMRWAMAAAAAVLIASPALAEPPWERGDWKEEYWQDGCKIERKWSRGGYKEEIKCRRPPEWRGRGAPSFRVPPPWAHRPIVLSPPPPGPIYGDIIPDRRGRYCREYQTTGIIDGRRQRLYGTVCLLPDGSWAFQD